MRGLGLHLFPGWGDSTVRASAFRLSPRQPRRQARCCHVNLSGQPAYFSPPQAIGSGRRNRTAEDRLMRPTGIPILPAIVGGRRGDRTHPLQAVRPFSRVYKTHPRTSADDRRLSDGSEPRHGWPISHPIAYRVSLPYPVKGSAAGRSNAYGGLERVRVIETPPVRWQRTARPSSYTRVILNLANACQPSSGLSYPTSGGTMT